MSPDTINDLARQARAEFTKRQRPDATEYTTLTDDRPEWVFELAHEAHGEMMPDDWRYETIHTALDAIAESPAGRDLDDVCSEFADSNVDTYTTDLLEWLSSHLTRYAYCDEAAAELELPGTDLLALIRAGQYAESEEVFASVRSSLEQRAEQIANEHPVQS